MVKKSILGLVTFALAVASAASSYNITLYKDTVVNGSTLKPGSYQVKVDNNTATIKQGKTVVEAPVKIENNGEKFSGTSLLVNGKDLQEIRVGGTHTRLVFENTGAATN